VTAVQWLAALRRRWYILVLAALCTGIVASAVHSRTISYQGCENLYLSEPSSSKDAFSYSNPLYGNQSVVVTAAIVTQTMMSQPIQQQLGRSGVSSGYSVAMTDTGDPRFPTYTQPSVQICAPAASSQGTMQSIEILTNQFRVTLQKMQSKQNVLPSSSITATITTPPSSGPVMGRPSQALLGVLVTGLLLGIAVTVRSDQLIHRVYSRHSAP
jgi:capsular polysaccharide biosynthesis protein